MDPLIRRQTLADLLHRSAAHHPGRTAVTCGDTRWSCAELDALCSRLAAGLAERGIGHGDRVAVLPKNPSGKLLKRMLRQS